MTTYCGSIGSVNVLEFMSTDLFDESQENPFLLHRHDPHGTSPSCSSAGSSPIKACDASASWMQLQYSLELPLEDTDGVNPPPYMGSPLKQSQQQAPSSPPRASVTFNLPKSILKRQSSYESSNASTAAASDTEAVDVNETELHKLLYSLARFSVASETSVASSALSQPPQPQPQYHPRQYSMSQPASPSPYNSSSQWSYEEDRGRARGFDAQPRRWSRSPSKKKKPQRCQSADRGYETDPGTMTSDDEDCGYSDGERSPGGRAMRTRGSVTFETVKNLLRGGGAIRTSRITKRSIPDPRHKSMGTVSSRLKCRQKFERLTILTDAYHRVSTMRLGTKPMSTKIKYLAFPSTDDHDPRYYEQEAYPGMPSPKGQLRHNSMILLETLDKIGTRAACPCT
ncbi:hypothetical protein FI667_g6962, partial [Globisporangium splendens]